LAAITSAELCYLCFVFFPLGAICRHPTHRQRTHLQQLYMRTVAGSVGMLHGPVGCVWQVQWCIAAKAACEALQDDSSGSSRRSLNKLSPGAAEQGCLCQTQSSVCNPASSRCEATHASMSTHSVGWPSVFVQGCLLPTGGGDSGWCGGAANGVHVVGWPLVVRRGCLLPTGRWQLVLWWRYRPWCACCVRALSRPVHVLHGSPRGCLLPGTWAVYWLLAQM
jgi:hypothetical protein